MEQLALGLSFLVDEEYQSALQKFNEAISIDSSVGTKALIYRAASFLGLKKFSQALEDCNRVINLDPDYEPNYFRKGVACFELEEFESAKLAFQTGLSKISGSKDKTQYSRWIRKCDVEISALEEEAGEGDSSETIKMDVQSDNNDSSQINKVADTSTPQLPNAPITVAPTPVKVRKEFYQSSTFANISVFAKNVNASDVTVEILPTHLLVIIRPPSLPSEVTVIDTSLYGEISVEKSKVEYFKTKIELSLSKIVPGNWPTLERSSNYIAPIATTTIALNANEVPNAVASVKRVKPYASHRDWDAVSSEIEKDLANDKPQGEEALQTLFRDIYSKATDETRRAMNKSFQTSGGTVLSTNWSEVKEKNYEEEKQAPKGMEWKTWEGEKVKQIED